MAGLLKQIQSDLLDERVSLSSTLRKARVLASQLKSEELTEWVKQELDGYKGGSALPDYRQLATSIAGTWTNGYWRHKNRQVHMHQIKDPDMKRWMTEFPVSQGIKSVEDFANGDENLRFMLEADYVALINHYVADGGYAYLSLHYTVSPINFRQVLDTIRNRLLEFIIQLDDKWESEPDPPTKDEVRQLINVTLHNSPGGTMSVFDQKGQNVKYQFNAAGDINFGLVNNIDQLVEAFGKLRKEIDVANEAKVIPDDVADETKFLILQASKEAKADRPNRDLILENLGRAKMLIDDFAAAVGLVTALAQGIEAVSKLF